MMGSLLLTARLLLAAVFLAAALAKLLDRRGARHALVDFGAPAALAPTLAVLLPLGELAAAAALLVVPWAWYGAVGALALLALFTAAIAVSLARGRTPDCHCFGQVSAGPIGWPTLLRNLVLASVAGFVVWTGRESAGPSALAWLSQLSLRDRAVLFGGIALLALVIAEAWVLLKLFTRHGRLLLRIEALEAKLTEGGGTPEVTTSQPAAGLPIGSRAPAFGLSGVHGETLTLDALRAAGKPVVLVFSDPGCGPCLALMPEVGRWQREHAAALALAVVSRGAPIENRAKYGEHGVTQVLLQKDREVAEAYRVNGTPSAVLVRPDGTVGSAAVPGADGIRRLVAQVLGTPAGTPTGGAPSVAHVPVPSTNGSAPLAPAPIGVKRGDAAPAVALPDLAGKTVKLRDYRGRATVLVFWNPGCGFCQQMTEDLRAWEETRQAGAPELLMVSTGGVEPNRAMGLTSAVVLDDSFTTGQAFGARGTPSAVLVDASGKVASEVAVGRPGVLALLGAAPDERTPGHPVVQATPTGGANGGSAGARPRGGVQH